eukprot:9493303-Pyramimonas_sp.AAC.1
MAIEPFEVLVSLNELAHIPIQGRVVPTANAHPPFNGSDPKPSASAGFHVSNALVEFSRVGPSGRLLQFLKPVCLVGFVETVLACQPVERPRR